MSHLRYNELADIELNGDIRAWFVTTYPGKYVGVPSAAWIVVFEIPRPHFVCIQIVDSPGPLWVHEKICALAKRQPNPEILVTDNVRLQSALVSAGSTFSKPAKTYIDKPMSKFPELTTGLKSVVDVLNDERLGQSVSEKNVSFASWCARYNDRLASR